MGTITSLPLFKTLDCITIVYSFVVSRWRTAYILCEWSTSLLHFPNETLHQSVHTLSLSISLITKTLSQKFVIVSCKLSRQYVTKINHQIAYGISKLSYCQARYKQASDFASEFNTTISGFSTCVSHIKREKT